MKVYFTIAALLVMACNSEAELGKQWMLHSGELAEKVRIEPSSENILELGGQLIGVTQYNSGSSAERRAIDNIISTLLAVPGHAQYFADEIERKQKEVADLPVNAVERMTYNSARARYFEVLRNLPSPETVKVLGRFLYDEKDTPEPNMTGQDWGPNPAENAGVAVMVLGDIGLRNPPVKPYLLAPELHSDAVSQCRTWWEKVKSGALAFSFVGQNVEYRFNPDGTWKTTPITNTPDDGVKPPKVANPTQGAMPQQTPLSKTNENPAVGHLWAWIIGGMLVALSGVLWIRMRYFAR